MTDKQTPPDWVLIEAAKRCEYGTGGPSYWAQYGQSNRAFRALCDMILKHEQPPVDRKLLCAREAIARVAETKAAANAWRDGLNDNTPGIQWTVRAIELWESGYGK